MIKRVTIPVIKSSDDNEIPDRRVVELGEQLFSRSDFKFSTRRTCARVI